MRVRTKRHTCSPETAIKEVLLSICMLKLIVMEQFTKNEYCVMILLYTLKNKIENNSTIKVNELKLPQVELFSFCHFMCVAANASGLFGMAHLPNMERFSYHSNLSFQMSNFLHMQTRQLALMKINSSARRSVFFSEKSQNNSR